MPSQHTHTHTYIHVHVYGERAVFSDEKPVCLFHIPLVPGATSEGRGSRHSCKTQMSGSKVALTPVRSRGERQERKEKKSKGGKVPIYNKEVFLNILGWELQKDTSSLLLRSYPVHFSPVCFYFSGLLLLTARSC